MNTSPESIERKERSHAILRARGVPLNVHLPGVESEADSPRRDARKVARRALALAAVALKGEGLEPEDVTRFLTEFEAASALSPKEQRFVADAQPSEHDRIQFTWRYECCYVMLWALGLVPELPWPDRPCDAASVIAVIQQTGKDKFFSEVELRSQAELLEAADLLYRCNWATTDARVNGRPAPAMLDPGVVQERHYALNWLIGYCNQAWDDVTTDT